MASWQIDIPGLTQLIAGAGAQGLKELALAGVDVHTLGCMLSIGELVPATQEFRRDMVRVREKQRKQSRWIYNAIEIGAGSCFLVDHLLKTRAGENVLALLVSTVSLMSDETCCSALSHLFEVAKAPADHTPGFYQLLKLREAVLTFARNVGFQEKVLQYHQLLAKLEGASVPYDHGLGESVPNNETLPRIIQFCRQVVVADDGSILVCKGFRGAAWIAAYTSLILGLPVCVINAAGAQVPISDNYGNSRVILHLNVGQNTCEVVKEAKVIDLISLCTLQDQDQCDWIVNCSKIEFLAYNYPDMTYPDDIKVVSDYVAIETLRKLRRHTHRGVTDLGSGEIGFQNYSVTILPHLQQRSLSILTLLGFGCGEVDDYRSYLDSNSEWSGYPRLVCIIGSDVNSPFYKSYAERELTSDYGQFTLDLQKLQKSFPNSKGLTRTLARAIDFASSMSFTDWDHSLQIMSASCFYVNVSPDGPRRRVKVPSSLYSEKSEETSLHSLIYRLSEFCLPCTDPLLTSSTAWDRPWLANQQCGIVICRNQLVVHSISKYRGIVLSLIQGRILYDGVQKSEIMADGRHAICEWGDEPLRDVRLRCNKYPELRSRFLVSGKSDVLLVSHEIINDDHLQLQAFEISDFSNQVQSPYSDDFLVSLPCPHDMDVSLDDEEWGANIHGKSGIFSVAIKDEEYFPGYHPKAILYYQQVDNNDLGQWIALNILGRGNFSRHYTILQDKTCLPCLKRRMNQAVEHIDPVWRPIFFNIIAGSLSGNPND